MCIRDRDDKLIAFLLPRHADFREEEQPRREEEQEAETQVAAEQQAAAEQEVADRALADRARSSEARRAGARVARSFESTGRFMCLDTSVEEVVRTPSRVGGGARRRSERGAAS